MAELFGFEINRKGSKAAEPVSFVPNTEQDGAGVISSGGHFGAYIDLDGDKVKNEIDLIKPILNAAKKNKKDYKKATDKKVQDVKNQEKEVVKPAELER